MSRWTEEDLAFAKRRLAVRYKPQPLQSKYRNQRVTENGQKFDSKAECEAWRAFELQRVCGGIRAIIRQVSMPLPGTTRRIRIDFLVVENDGTHRWYDKKGFTTAEFKLKSAIVRQAYGIEIQLI
jgi:hypothetical protein